jgi:hypothetical protein
MHVPLIDSAPRRAVKHLIAAKDTASINRQIFVPLGCRVAHLLLGDHALLERVKSGLTLQVFSHLGQVAFEFRIQGLGFNL